MQKIKSALKSPVFYAGLGLGVIVALAFGRFIPGFVRKAAAAIPGSDAKTAA